MDLIIHRLKATTQENTQEFVYPHEEAFAIGNELRLHKPKEMGTTSGNKEGESCPEDCRNVSPFGYERNRITQNEAISTPNFAMELSWRYVSARSTLPGISAQY